MYCDGQPFATTIQNAWENHDFKNAISHICICNVFEILKDYCRLPYLLML